MKQNFLNIALHYEKKGNTNRFKVSISSKNSSNQKKTRKGN